MSQPIIEITGLGKKYRAWFKRFTVQRFTVKETGPS